MADLVGDVAAPPPAAAAAAAAGTASPAPRTSSVDPRAWCGNRGRAAAPPPAAVGAADADGGRRRGRRARGFRTSIPGQRPGLDVCQGGPESDAGRSRCVADGDRSTAPRSRDDGGRAGGHAPRSGGCGQPCRDAGESPGWGRAGWPRDACGRKKGGSRSRGSSDSCQGTLI